MRELGNCPICTSLDRKIIYPSTLSSAIHNMHTLDPYSAHYQINECESCDLRFSSPIMNEEDLVNLYCNSENGNISAGEEENVKRTMFNYYNLVKKYISSRDRALDVGCDVGYFLQAALNDGFNELHGLEPTKPAREIAQKIPKSVLSEKFYEEITYASNYFDLISMIHVLDHLVDPSIALLKAKQELKTGGILVAVVHNSKSMLGRIMGEKFPVYNLYHHYFFTKVTLRKLLESKGFDVIKVISTTNCYSLSFFIKKIPLLPDFLKSAMLKLANFFKVSRLAVNIPVGNIGVVARKID